MMYVRDFDLSRGLGDSVDRVYFMPVWVSGCCVDVTLEKRMFVV